MTDVANKDRFVKGLADQVGGKEDLETPELVRRPSKEMKFVSLHHHSTYSYVDGFGLPKSHVHRAAELGMPHLALTEHGNVSSHAKLETAAAAYGIKPIYGCELYTGKVDAEERTRRKNHLTVLAATNEGYRNLLRVVSQGYDDFYQEPTVSGEVLAAHKEGLIILSGCTGSLLATSLVGGKNIDPKDASYKRGKEVAARFKRVFGDAYYLEVQMFPELENVRRINQMLERIGQELDIPLVATGDFHYTKPEHNEIQQLLHSIGRHKTLEQLAQDWGYEVSLAPPLTDKAVYDRLRGTGLSHRATEEAIASTLEIAHRCNAVIPHMDPLRFPIPDGYRDKDHVWKAWLEEGWYFRGVNRHPRAKEYKARLHYEMSIIEQKDFVDYFLFVSDIVKWAKGEGIAVGPGRGSAAGSLVCWLLRITEVDPLAFPNLIFERFIDINRADLPDIDLDFDDERREEVFRYAELKYGREYVGRIGSYNQFKSKNSLDDVAKVYGIPPWKVDKVKEVLVERSSGDLRASATIEDTVEQFDQAREVFEEHPELWQATQLEGNVKSMGVHAAGLVVSTQPIRDVCAVYKRKDAKGNVRLDDNGVPMEVVSFDKYDAENHGLLKMDILGLSNMGLIAMAADFIGIPLQTIYDLPLDDPEAIAGFTENDVVGVFQFDGWSTKSVNDQLRPTNFLEIADVNALSRPGPLHSGSTTEYGKARAGLTPSISHPAYDPIVASTYGQIVYQEQILRIVTEIGGFDWVSSSYIRRIISRKIGEQEFNRQRAKFMEGVRAKGEMGEELADRIWNSCITAGSYAFNAAHSVSYSMISYWTMWLKRHHPAAFYAAALHKLASSNKEKLLPLLRDTQRHGRDMAVLPPDPAMSGWTWRPEGDHAIRAGFRQIPGIGEKTAKLIVEERERLGGFATWRDLGAVKGIGVKTIANMESFADEEDPFNIWTTERLIAKVTEEIRQGKLGRVPVPTHNSVDVPVTQGPDIEVVWLGYIKSRNVRDLFEVNNAKKGVELDPESVKAPHLREWVNMHAEDHTDRIMLGISRFVYPKFKSRVWKLRLDKDLVLIRGIKVGYQARRALQVTDMWIIDPEDD